MKRFFYIITLLAMLVPVVAVAGPSVNPDLLAWMDKTDDRLVGLEARVNALEEAMPSSPTSSSGVDTTVTSTTVQSAVTVSSGVQATPTSQATSTTVAPPTTAPSTITTVRTTNATTATTTTTTTTTTTEAPTTTIRVSSGDLVIPPTRDYVTDGMQSNETFLAHISCGDTETVECDVNADGNRKIGSAFVYAGHEMPYLYSEVKPGNHDHAWWVPGDREKYQCLYAFMYDKHPNPFGMFSEPRPAEFIARATVLTPKSEEQYGRVTDKFMDEAVRYYDGSAFDGGTNEIPEESCRTVALDDINYETLEPSGPDDIRVGLFRADGEIGDIRDFTKFNHKVPGHFEFHSFVNGRVTILHFLGATNRVSHVFYYDVMNSGKIAVEVNGSLISG